MRQRGHAAPDAMRLPEPTEQAMRFYATALDCLVRDGVPFLIGGAYAMREYAGIFRDTKDLDVFCRPDDARRVLAALAGAGCRTEVWDPVWLAKAFQDDLFIDVIFNAGNGLGRVDDAWFCHARDVLLFGVPVQLIPPEELIWSKAYVQTRERYDGADIAHVMRQQGPTLDWRRLLERIEPHWEVLLMHIVNFRYVYPSERPSVPQWLVRDLCARIERQLADPTPRGRVCRGPLLAPREYEVDVAEWGYEDPRTPGRGGRRAGGAGRRADRRDR